MYHKGLNKQIIIETSVQMIEESGTANFSLHSLASRLGIKTASLYTHIANLEEIINEVGIYAITLQRCYEEKAIEGKTGDEAIYALANSYLLFATEHSELYKVNMSAYHSTQLLKEKGPGLKEPFESVLASYGLEDQDIVHWQRIFRCMMHGFTDLQDQGFFTYYKASKENTYQLAIQSCIDGLHQFIIQKNSSNN